MKYLIIEHGLFFAIKENIKRSVNNYSLFIVSTTNLNFDQPQKTMKIFKRTSASALLIGFLFLTPFGIVAQPADPCPDPSLGDCPIDSNVYFLIAAAIIIAAKKTYDYKKKQVII